MENYLGEIKLYPYGFVPAGSLLCDGRELSVAQYTALFAVIGTTYGGNGTTTFALPDLRGRAPMGFGNGPGLTAHKQGETGGAATVALTVTNTPPHTHQVRMVQPTAANSNLPTGQAFAAAAGHYGPAENLVANQSCIAPAGSNQPHNNMQPYIALNYCIVVDGIFPQPS
jgi:microcystin-dependent protein